MDFPGGSDHFDPSSGDFDFPPVDVDDFNRFTNYDESEGYAPGCIIPLVILFQKNIDNRDRFGNNDNQESYSASGEPSHVEENPDANSKVTADDGETIHQTIEQGT